MLDQCHAVLISLYLCLSSRINIHPIYLCFLIYYQYGWTLFFFLSFFHPLFFSFLNFCVFFFFNKQPHSPGTSRTCRNPRACGTTRIASKSYALIYVFVSSSLYLYVFTCTCAGLLVLFTVYANNSIGTTKCFLGHVVYVLVPD